MRKVRTTNVSPLVFRQHTSLGIVGCRARARSFLEHSILSEKSSLTFFESLVPRVFADRFVRVNQIFYLVSGIFLFNETLSMVCCIASEWKI
jgi:hypothetical protein